jgi:hypothetical protein
MPKTTVQELRTIPGVGKVVAQDLLQMGYRSVADLKSADPDLMYIEHNNLRGHVQDICMLYTFRAAVYYAKTVGKKQDPKKLKWWNWMDDKKLTSIEKDAEIRAKRKIPAPKNI